MNEARLKPSALVDSGHGTHAYWLLTEPLLFATPEDRNEVSKLTVGWHELVCRKAAARSWSLENLGDLPRILRVPGTITG